MGRPLRLMPWSRASIEKPLCWNGSMFSNRTRFSEASCLEVSQGRRGALDPPAVRSGSPSGPMAGGGPRLSADPRPLPP